MEGLISVIVPIYNVDEYLEKCIRSVLNQTYKYFELILINDGSTDNSRKICDTLSTQDNRIKVIHKDNSGVSSTRNVGIKKINGKYLYFMDSDDWIEDDFFEKMVYAMKENDLDICICNFYIEYVDKSQIFTKFNKTIEFNTLNSIKELLRQDGKNIFLGHLWNKMFLTEKVKSILFNENISIYEDTEYVYKALKKCNKIMYIPYIGYHYIQRKSSAIKSNFSKKTISSIEVSKYILNDVLKMGDSSLKDIAVSYYIRTNLKQASLCSYTGCNYKYLKIIKSNIVCVKNLINRNQFYTKKDKILLRLISFNHILFDCFYKIIIKPQKNRLLKNEGRRLYL